MTSQRCCSKNGARRARRGAASGAGLDHKVGGQVAVFRTHGTQMLHHRRRGVTSPTRGTPTERGKPVAVPRVDASQGTSMRQRAQEEGASEGRPVMGRRGVAPPGNIIPPARGQTSLWSCGTRKFGQPLQKAKQMT